MDFTSEQITARSNDMFQWLLNNQVDPQVWMFRFGGGVLVFAVLLYMFSRVVRRRSSCKWRVVPTLDDSGNTRWICRSCGEEAFTHGPQRPATCMRPKRG